MKNIEVRRDISHQKLNNRTPEVLRVSVNQRVRPAIKWVGGKGQLLPFFENKFPKCFGKYIDPFLGAGAVPLWLRPRKACLSDLNEELIITHVMIRDNVEEVIVKLNEHIDHKEHYNLVRSQDWMMLEPVEIAARMIYLNKTCFNGLYRVNRSGGFNASYATPPQRGRKISNPEQLRAVSNALKNYEIKCCGFKEALQKAEPNDLVFLDPPYDDAFSSYTSTKFSKDDQRLLASEFQRLDEMGCYVISCNSNNEFISALYFQYEIETVDVRRSINCDKNGRTGTEVIIYSANKIPANDDV